MTTPTPHGAMPELPEPNICEVTMGTHSGTLSYYTERDLLDYAKFKQSQRERVYESLLKQCVGQLKAWHSKYGENGPSWLPPGGDVRLMETIDDWLNSAPEYPIPSPRAAIQQAAGAVPELTDAQVRELWLKVRSERFRTPPDEGDSLPVMFYKALLAGREAGSSDHLVPCAGGNVHEWQPIETAPKDGTEVMGFRGDAGVFVMRWIAPVDFLTETELADPHAEDRDWQEEPDWFYADFIQGGRLDGTEAPTHWMPLPAAPKSTPWTAVAQKSNALRVDHPLAQGKCVHGVAMSANCPACGKTKPAQGDSGDEA